MTVIVIVVKIMRREIETMIRRYYDKVFFFFYITRNELDHSYFGNSLLIMMREIRTMIIR